MLDIMLTLLWTGISVIVIAITVLVVSLAAFIIRVLRAIAKEMQ